MRWPLRPDRDAFEGVSQCPRTLRAGRLDLLGEQHTRGLTRAQYATLRRLAALPGTVRVLPTHGAGSFCVAVMPATRRTSTIAAENEDNPLLAAPDLAAFSAELCSELMAHPAYYAHMARVNRAGALRQLRMATAGG